MNVTWLLQSQEKMYPKSEFRDTLVIQRLGPTLVFTMAKSAVKKENNKECVISKRMDWVAGSGLKINSE